MATITDWVNGNHNELDFGSNYFQRCRSLEVHEGEVVTIFGGQDRTGFKSVPFYQGSYPDLSFYGCPESPGLILIEKTPLKFEDLIQVNTDKPWGQGQHYNAMQMIPVGDHPDLGSLGDQITGIQIPYGVSVQAFRDPAFQGGFLEFTGRNRDGHSIIDLNVYNFRQVISSLKVIKDDWEPAGMSLENETIDTSGSGERIAKTIELSINDTDIGATVTDVISTEKVI